MASKQLTLFSQQEDSSVNEVNCNDSQAWQLYTDGASRNNPGPSGIGFSLKKDSKVICEQGFYVGIKTNNQAEYIAMLVGIIFAKKFMKPTDKLAVFCDSQLIVRQMRGQYRVKDAQLKKLKEAAYDAVQGMQYSFCHVYRNQNKRADELANRGVDKKTSLPKKIGDMLAHLELS